MACAVVGLARPARRSRGGGPVGPDRRSGRSGRHRGAGPAENSLRPRGQSRVAPNPEPCAPSLGAAEPHRGLEIIPQPWRRPPRESPSAGRARPPTGQRSGRPRDPAKPTASAARAASWDGAGSARSGWRDRGQSGDGPVRVRSWRRKRAAFPFAPQPTRIAVQWKSRTILSASFVPASRYQQQARGLRATPMNPLPPYFFRRGVRDRVFRPAVVWSRYRRICSTDSPASRASGGSPASRASGGSPASRASGGSPASRASGGSPASRTSADRPRKTSSCSRTVNLGRCFLM